MSAKQILINWLAKNELKKVVQGLFFLAKKYKDEQLRSNTAFQSGRFKSLENQRLKDTISQEENHLQAARLREALIDLINDLPDDWTLDGIENAPASFVASPMRNWKKYAAYFTAAVALLAGLAELSGYSIRDFFQEKEPTEIPEKVERPSPDVSTTGDNSPAVITDEGDVNINYGEPTSKKDSTHTPKNPQK